ncbi:MAG: alanine racemase [Rhodospirillales bacterium]|jgi:alanine racemase|nr:alanine racemase [Rhodospirillales bacterium]MDP6884311.1 alanine racemase [Rhodospirillales bacterium]
MSPLNGPTSESRYARPIWIEVDLSAIAHNVGVIRRHVGAATKIFTTLKANGYGHGLLKAAQTVESAGADAVALVALDDAVRIREHGIKLPILLFGGNLVCGETIDAAIRYDLTLTVHDGHSAEMVIDRGEAPLRIFVEVNTGGERLGVAPSEVAAIVGRLREFPHIEVAGVYTHPGVPSGEGAVECVDWQYGRFLSALGNLDDAGLEVPLRMASSSKMLLMGDRMVLNGVDPGNLVFGLDPGGPGKFDLDVRPALIALKSRLIHCHKPERSKFTDQAPFPVRDGMRVGVIPMGASDRLDELHCGEVLVRGRRAPVLGKLSAEHTKIDVTDVPEAEVGDEVVIIGCQGDGAITIGDVTQRRGGVLSDVAQALPRPLPRLYGSEGAA